MHALILLAHGSRRQESNDEIKTLTGEIKKIAGDNFDLIEYAYLELVEPDLGSAINQVIDAGATAVTVFPYFLNSGNHVKRDIPEIVDRARQRYPDCDFTISDCIGMYRGMPALIVQQAMKH